MRRLETSLPIVKRMCKLLPKPRRHRRNREVKGKYLEKEKVVPKIRLAESTEYLPGRVSNLETALHSFYLFFFFFKNLFPANLISGFCVRA